VIWADSKIKRTQQNPDPRFAQMFSIITDSAVFYGRRNPGQPMHDIDAAPGFR
jgi:hypothetical protein